MKSFFEKIAKLCMKLLSFLTIIFEICYDLHLIQLPIKKFTLKVIFRIKLFLTLVKMKKENSILTLIPNAN
jgi:hypothetical protein